MKKPTLLLPIVPALIVVSTLAEPVYFLATRPTVFGEFVGSLESYVVPLESDEQIAHARFLISLGPEADCEHNRLMRLKIGAGDGGVNRNLLAPGAPFWKWHVERVESFLCAYFVDLPGPPPSYHSLQGLDANPAHLERAIAEGWQDRHNVIVAELNPALTTQMRVDANGDLVLTWDNLGAFYVFTVEQREMSSAGDWQPVPAVTWPIREHSWTIPTASLTPPARLYRVRAELQVPE